MLVHNEQSFCIYFAGNKSSLEKFVFEKITQEQKLWDYQEFVNLKKIMKLEKLIFLQQIHSDNGLVIDQKVGVPDTDFIKKKIEGDFLITKLEHVGLCIYTADCLPIVFYDKINNVIGICHAGWLGSIKQIAVKTVQRMQEQFNTSINYLNVFFGPCAKVCCYEIQEDFCANIKDFNLTETVIRRQNNKLFFDLPLFNKIQLSKIGIKKEAFKLIYNLCTICNESFCSYRRDKNSKRQLTVVALRAKK